MFLTALFNGNFFRSFRRDTSERDNQTKNYNRRNVSMSDVSRGEAHDNIFKSMNDLEFKQTISHQCGVTMNESVEARAISEFMATKPDVTVTNMPAMIRIDGVGKLIFKMDEISDILGREMNAETFEVNTSTHYGRMVRIDDNTVILFGDMDEMMEYI
jgi:propane monooxygenase coupling protein